MTELENHDPFNPAPVQARNACAKSATQHPNPTNNADYCSTAPQSSGRPAASAAVAAPAAHPAVVRVVRPLPLAPVLVAAAALFVAAAAGPPLAPIVLGDLGVAVGGGGLHRHRLREGSGLSAAHVGPDKARHPGPFRMTKFHLASQSESRRPRRQHISGLRTRCAEGRRGAAKGCNQEGNPKFRNMCGRNEQSRPFFVLVELAGPKQVEPNALPGHWMETGRIHTTPLR